MLTKLGVDISRLARPMRRALRLLDNLYKKYATEFVITSTYEGDHGPDSLHYANLALDGRKIRILSGTQTRDKIKTKLGNKFDVLWHKGHIHIEYDPK